MSQKFRLGGLVRLALNDLGVDLDRLRAAEPDAALGNGGLGRLAACLMDSMAALGIPACGYGIRYDHGFFRQVIVDGWQQEMPEHWLSSGNPWEFERPEIVYDVGYGGRVDHIVENGRPRAVWQPNETVEAVAYDTPVVGWRGRHVNLLRLWSARAVDPLRLDIFNEGEHVAALAQQARAEAISKILYPADNTPAGQELRLRQEYFFVSASIQDLVKQHVLTHGNIFTLPQQASIQLNDTHPAIAVAELMRICSTAIAYRGTAPGGLAAPPAPTPTIRCCRRRSNAGRSPCSSDCCRAISKSSIGLTTTTSPPCGRASRRRPRRSRHYR